VLEGAKLPGRTGNASVAGGRLLPSASGPSYLDPVSLKIVFNGAEYDSVEAMPPDVRAQYNEVLESLKKTGGDEVLSALQRVSSGTGGLSETIVTTHREIVVNGKKYGSLGEMPPDVRRLYEKALGQAGAGAGLNRPSSGALRPPPPPPVIEDDQTQRGGVLRILMWMALGAAIAWWLLRR
jgi:hypothetical protein